MLNYKDVDKALNTNILISSRFLKSDAIKTMVFNPYWEGFFVTINEEQKFTDRVDEAIKWYNEGFPNDS
jgi:hypothetical protein